MKTKIPNMKYKVKSPLCISATQRGHVEGAEVKLHAFLTLALNASE
jgi:hypothetical protein